VIRRRFNLLSLAQYTPGVDDNFGRNRATTKPKEGVEKFSTCE
jgi:hypothetical protein